MTFDLPLELLGTEFHRRCWLALASIPYGQTVSYGEQARRLGWAATLPERSGPRTVATRCDRVAVSSSDRCGRLADRLRWRARGEALSPRARGRAAPPRLRPEPRTSVTARASLGLCRSAEWRGSNSSSGGRSLPTAARRRSTQFATRARARACASCTSRRRNGSTCGVPPTTSTRRSSAGSRCGIRTARSGPWDRRSCSTR